MAQNSLRYLALQAKDTKLNQDKIIDAPLKFQLCRRHNCLPGEPPCRCTMCINNNGMSHGDVQNCHDRVVYQLSVQLTNKFGSSMSVFNFTNNETIGTFRGAKQGGGAGWGVATLPPPLNFGRGG